MNNDLCGIHETCTRACGTYLSFGNNVECISAGSLSDDVLPVVVMSLQYRNVRFYFCLVAYLLPILLPLSLLLLLLIFCFADGEERQTGREREREREREGERERQTIDQQEEKQNRTGEIQ